LAGVLSIVTRRRRSPPLSPLCLAVGGAALSTSAWLRCCSLRDLQNSIRTDRMAQLASVTPGVLLLT